MQSSPVTITCTELVNTCELHISLSTNLAQCLQMDSFEDNEQGS